MSLDPRLRRALWWGVPIVVAAGALAAELGVGARPAVPPETRSAPKPVDVGVLPEYGVPGGAGALAATTEHPLFNPTRRPAPPSLASGSSGPSQMKRGQFVLTGTLVADDVAVAYLKEVAGGKTRTVKKGEKVNGMTVASVDAQGVRLAQGDESEQLSLKLATGPKVTVQPAVEAPAAPAQPGLPVPAGGGGQPVQRATNAPAPGAGTPANMTPSERRRAARAAQQALAQQQGDGPAATTGPTTGSTNTRQPSQRMNNRGGTATPQ